MTAVSFGRLGSCSSAISDADDALLAVPRTVGVLASVVQFLGLICWPFLPLLARVAAEPDTGPTRGDIVDVVCRAANRYLGVSVGEHLGLPRAVGGS